MKDIYAEVTRSIITKLGEGTIPWRRPWTPPTNYISRKPYSGINVWLLHDGTSPYWLTYRQAMGLGGYVRRGERGTRIIYWRILDREVANGTGDMEVRRIPLLRYYTVFNLDQCDGIVDRPPLEPVGSAEDIIHGYQNPPSLEYGGSRASYVPSSDAVHMPAMDAFQSSAAYYSTLFHELVHSTGHSSRLDRVLGTQYASDAYSTEELVAEMGAAYLCATSSTELVAKSMDSMAAYIQHWIGKLEGDKYLVVRVSSSAQRAADWVQGVRPTCPNESEGTHLSSQQSHPRHPTANPTTIPPAEHQ